MFLQLLLHRLFHFFLSGTHFWTQSLQFARQVLYHLSHISSPVFHFSADIPHLLTPLYYPILLIIQQGSATSRKPWVNEPPSGG
jgi:hypothetical protein